MQGVILAAGKGKRLRPLSDLMSKALAPVLNRPIIVRILEDCLEATGILDWVIVTCEANADIQAYFERALAQDGALPAGLSVRFTWQEERLGMAHALGCAAPLLTEDFLLCACDNMFPVEHIRELCRTHRETNANGTLSVKEVPVEEFAKTGIVDIDADGCIAKIIEKPTPEEAPSNVGSLPLYIFSPRILRYLDSVPLSKRGEYEIQDAIQMVIDRDGGVRGVYAPDRHSLTSVEDLRTINLDCLAAQGGDDLSLLSRHFPGVAFHSPVLVGPNAAIGEGSVIGPQAIVGEACVIGRGVTVRESVLVAGTHAPDGAVIERQLLHPPADANA